MRIESAPKATRPALSKLHQSHRRWREGHELASISSLAARQKRKRAPLGTTFTFELNERATVRFVFARLERGRNGKRSRTAGVLTYARRPGKNRVRFQGRISRYKRLTPGRYRLTAIARSGSQRSKPKSLTFTIVR